MPLWKVRAGLSKRSLKGICFDLPLSSTRPNLAIICSNVRLSTAVVIKSAAFSDPGTLSRLTLRSRRASWIQRHCVSRCRTLPSPFRCAMPIVKTITAASSLEESFMSNIVSVYHHGSSRMTTDGSASSRPQLVHGVKADVSRQPMTTKLVRHSRASWSAVSR